MSMLYVFEEGPQTLRLGSIGAQPILAECFRCAVAGVTQEAIAGFHGFAGPSGPQLAYLTDPATGRSYHGYLCELHVAEALGRISGHSH